MLRPGCVVDYGHGRSMLRPYRGDRPFPTSKRLPQHRLHQQLRLFLALGDLRFQGVDGGHEAVDTGDDGLLFGEGGGRISRQAESAAALPR